MKNNYWLLLLMLCNSVLLNAQKSIVKWGKLTQAEVDLQTVEFDTSASAVILYDGGMVSAQIGDGVTFNRHTRIKILKESGKEFADIGIPYYHEDGAERITRQKAQIINVVNGKPVKQELSKKEFFRVKINDRWSELKFTFPQVKAGSIIEYTYTTESNNYTSLESWDFKNSIPTLRSKIKVLISQGLDYKIMYQGQRLGNKYADVATQEWELEDLPAIRDENFCPNPFDFTEKIKFQLAQYVSGGRLYHAMSDWKEVTKDMYDEGGMRRFLNNNQDAKKILEQILTGNESDTEKIQKIYDYVTQNFSWNKRFSFFPTENYKTFKTNSSGTSAEINLFLINLLQQADFEVLPALLSTKSHGFVAKNIPFFTQFNNLVACVKIDGKDQLIDATSSLRPFSLLNKENNNFEALVLNKKAPYWVKIPRNKSNQQVNLINMSVPEIGKLKIKYEINAKGYEAEDLRKDYYRSEKDLNTLFAKTLISQDAEFQIKATDIKAIDEVKKPLYLSAEIIDNNLSTVNEDYVYISPFIDKNLTSNPFNDKDRQLPVDLYYPFTEQYILKFEIPEGYEAIEIPESVNLVTEGNKAMLQFVASTNDDTIQLRMMFKINDPFFMPYEYTVLSEIFDLFLEKRAEQIVLKKKA